LAAADCYASAGCSSCLRSALFKHQLLIFRDQNLLPDELLKFSRIFGDPEAAKSFFPRLRGEELVETLEAGPGIPDYGNDDWHSGAT
jgi:taurine dioxygenase